SIAVKSPAPAIRFHFLRASFNAGRRRTGRSGTERYCVTIQEFVPTIRFVQKALAIDRRKPTDPAATLADVSPINPLTLRKEVSTISSVKPMIGSEKKPVSIRNFGRCSL